MDISLDEAEKLFFTDAAVFIDARSEEDYARGHIQGALSLPWHEVDLRFIGRHGGRWTWRRRSSLTATGRPAS